MKTVVELVNVLFRNQKVLGLVQYGSRKADDVTPGGDLDLFVFVNERLAPLESIHFYCQTIPVDLNIRILDDLKRKEPLTPIDPALFSGNIVFDKTGRLEQLIEVARREWGQTPLGASEHEIAFERFSKKHVIDKVQHRLGSDPFMSNFLLFTNVYWLVCSYFSLRGLPFPGEKQALVYLQETEPTIYKLLEDFYAPTSLEEKLAISVAISQKVLEPFGGLWNENEILAFGLTENTTKLAEKGELVYQELFGQTITRQE